MKEKEHKTRKSRTEDFQRVTSGLTPTVSNTHRYTLKTCATSHSLPFKKNKNST